MMITPALILLLARVCVNEAGFNVQDQECAAIHYILKTRAEKTGRTYERQAHLYAPSAWRRTGRNGWISRLSVSLARPAGFPVQLDWNSVYKSRWRRALVVARRVLSRDIEPRCTSDHWGAKHGPFYERAKARGWREVCLGMGFRNAYWRLR